MNDVKSKDELKVEIFSCLLQKFETDEVRKYCEDMIKEIPDYFFTVPASSSLKYHNITQCMTHGLVYHTIMVGEMLNYILDLDWINNEGFMYPVKRDLMRCAAIFHDALKKGKEEHEHTLFEHPFLASVWVERTNVEHDIDMNNKKYISRLCKSHSGQWNTSKDGVKTLSTPSDLDEFLIHLADYLASRRNIDMVEYNDKFEESLIHWREYINSKDDKLDHVLNTEAI